MHLVYQMIHFVFDLWQFLNSRLDWEVVVRVCFIILILTEYRTLHSVPEVKMFFHYSHLFCFWKSYSQAL